MKTSARNQLAGTVTAVRPGAVNDEVELALASGGKVGTKVVAIITHASTVALGLKPQAGATALIKASHVLLATGLGSAKVSARNQLHGTVRAVAPGAVNSEVTLELDGGGGAQIVAIVTEASVKALGLVPGAKATALVKASDVILAVPG